MLRCFAILCIWGIVESPFVLSQVPNKTQVEDAGLRELQSGHFRLITDLPLNDEIRLLPQVFEQAIPLWKEYFGLSIDDLNEWRAVGALIQDRSRFVKIGLITSNIPDFKDGFQAGSRLFFVEQPSAYYRRHLMIHEGTHWFMYKLFGGGGPTWYMEGMAELLATHTWDGKALKLGVIPSNSQEVPYWGRVKVIDEQMRSGRAPSLEAIMEYEGSARMEVDIYAWSWAACVFMMNHPDTQVALREVAHSKLDYSKQLNKDLKRKLGDAWPLIRTEWEGFASELGYGYDLQRALPILSKQTMPLGGKSKEIQVRADRGWQATGVSVKVGDKLSVKASGKFTIAKTTAEWISEPQGVTLRYVAGQPIGKLQACIASLPEAGTLQTKAWRPISIGAQSEWKVEQDGELMFRLNDSSSELSDNAGSIRVLVEPK